MDDTALETVLPGIEYPSHIKLVDPDPEFDVSRDARCMPWVLAASIGIVTYFLLFLYP